MHTAACDDAICCWVQLLLLLTDTHWEGNSNLNTHLLHSGHTQPSSVGHSAHHMPLWQQQQQ
jgi:hypothetical protein